MEGHEPLEARISADQTLERGRELLNRAEGLGMLSPGTMRMLDRVYETQPQVQARVERGRCLSSYLDPSHFKVYYYPGVRIHQVVTVPNETFKPDVVLYMVGINNLTKLLHNPRRLSLHYENRELLLSSIMDPIIDSGLFLHTCFPGVKVIFGGVIGADISYNNLGNQQPNP